jgi:hypothetical protein
MLGKREPDSECSQVQQAKKKKKRREASSVVSPSIYIDLTDESPQIQDGNHAAGQQEETKQTAVSKHQVKDAEMTAPADPGMKKKKCRRPKKAEA